MSEHFRANLGEKNGAVEVDRYCGGEVFLEVFDYSRFDGEVGTACVSLTVQQARDIANSLLRAAAEEAVNV
jgi:hypothetical protein